MVAGAFPGLLLRVFGLVALFLGLMLVLCSRDLKHRGVLVMWEGVLRLVGGSVILGYGILGGCGIATGIAGLGDLAIGIVYLVCLPRHLEVSAMDLLLDRHASSSSRPRVTAGFQCSHNPGRPDPSPRPGGKRRESRGERAGP